MADRYKASITAALASAGISSDAVPSLSVALEESPSPFHGIDSNYLFEKYCVDNFGCLVSAVSVYTYVHCSNN